MAACRGKSFIITIDGPAGSGKSTTARRVAERLGYSYLDSGALYRAVTWAALQQNIDLQDSERVARLAEQLDLVFQAGEEGLRILVNGRDVSREIRMPEVTQAIAPVAANSGVRYALLDTQRRFGKQGGVVAEGRDMGTVVFPDADVKFFMVASLQERAERRQAELAAKGVAVPLEELKRSLQQRDDSDRQRAHSPLRRPQEAIDIDTSRLSIDEQVDLVIREVLKKLNA
ncbi:MAG TPA: (d)CMP kinase [bacterium]|nr:(d)CMP kinase [bacterium]HPN34685.1 (d)CMP kinase [bacterium]